MDDWEAMAEEHADEQSKSKPQSVQPDGATETASPTARSTDYCSALLSPVAAMRQPLLDSLCQDVNVALASVGSLQEVQAPPLPSSPLSTADFDVRFLGEDIKEEGDILKDKSAHRNTIRQTRTAP